MLTVASGAVSWADVPDELPGTLGTAGQVLEVNAAATGVEWSTVASGNLPALGDAGQVLTVNDAESAAAWQNAPVFSRPEGRQYNLGGRLATLSEPNQVRISSEGLVYVSQDDTDPVFDYTDVLSVGRVWELSEGTDYRVYRTASFTHSVIDGDRILVITPALLDSSGTLTIVNDDTVTLTTEQRELPDDLGTAGQVLTVDADGVQAEWADVDALPTLGDAGQVLTINTGETAAEWADAGYYHGRERERPAGRAYQMQWRSGSSDPWYVASGLSLINQIHVTGSTPTVLNMAQQTTDPAVDARDIFPVDTIVELDRIAGGTNHWLTLRVTGAPTETTDGTIRVLQFPFEEINRGPSGYGAPSGTFYNVITNRAIVDDIGDEGQVLTVTNGTPDWAGPVSELVFESAEVSDTVWYSGTWDNLLDNIAGNGGYTNAGVGNSITIPEDGYYHVLSSHSFGWTGSQSETDERTVAFSRLRKTDGNNNEVILGPITSAMSLGEFGAAWEHSEVTSEVFHYFEAGDDISPEISAVRETAQVAATVKAKLWITRLGRGATGPKGVTGDVGATGAAGADGNDIPAVDSTNDGQIARVVSGDWAPVDDPLPTTATAGQVLTWNGGSAEWQAADSMGGGGGSAITSYKTPPGIWQTTGTFDPNQNPNNSTVSTAVHTGCIFPLHHDPAVEYSMMYKASNGTNSGTLRQSLYVWDEDEDEWTRVDTTTQSYTNVGTGDFIAMAPVTLPGTISGAVAGHALLTCIASGSNTNLRVAGFQPQQDTDILFAGVLLFSSVVGTNPTDFTVSAYDDKNYYTIFRYPTS